MQEKGKAVLTSLVNFISDMVPKWSFASCLIQIFMIPARQSEWGMSNSRCNCQAHSTFRKGEHSNQRETQQKQWCRQPWGTCTSRFLQGYLASMECKAPKTFCEEVFWQEPRAGSFPHECQTGSSIRHNQQKQYQTECKYLKSSGNSSPQKYLLKFEQT